MPSLNFARVARRHCTVWRTPSTPASSKTPYSNRFSEPASPNSFDHLTAFTSESFGGPERFTRELGFTHLVSVHRNLHITEEQRRRFVQLYMAALDESDLPDDGVTARPSDLTLEFGSKVAMPETSRAETEDELIPCGKFLVGPGAAMTRGS